MARRGGAKLLQAGNDACHDQHDRDVNEEGEPVLAAPHDEGPIGRDEGHVEHDKADNDGHEADPGAPDHHRSDDGQNEDQRRRRYAHMAAEREHCGGRNSHRQHEGGDAGPGTAPNGSLLHALESLGPSSW